MQNIHIPGHQIKPNPVSSPEVAISARVITNEDKSSLQGLLGDVTTNAVLALYDATIASGNNRLDPKANAVKFPQMERHDRGKVHKVSVPLATIDAIGPLIKLRK